MSLKEKNSTINEKMVKIISVVDEDSEAARLQSSALAGILLGAWVMAAAFEMGYSPLIAAGMVTIGVIGGIGIRTIK